MRLPKSIPGFLTLSLSIASIALLIVFFLVLAILNRMPEGEPEFGITFSTVYARQLGIDWKLAYTDLVQNVGVKRVRLPIYWDEVEKEKNEYDWEHYDWIVEESELNNVELTIVLGQKVPRWPECFIPDWAEKIDPHNTYDELNEFIALAVGRYKDSPALHRWQIENEALFPFGECPRPSVEEYAGEIALVRELDPDHQIQITVSGELEPYFNSAVPADVLGISMYRITWNNLFGYFYYPITPAFYRAKAKVVEPFVDSVIISELQAEPWFPEAIDAREPQEWYEVFTEKDMRRNIDFARRTGLDEAYLWGAEWWYFLKENGEPRLWNVAEELF